MAIKRAILVALGERIRKERISQGYSQESFSEKVGLDRAYYSGVERGERNISSINLVRIAISLNVEVGKLFPKISELKSLDIKEGD